MGNKSLLVAIVFVASLPFAALAGPKSMDDYRPQDAVVAATSMLIPSVVGIETRFKAPELKDDFANWQQFHGARPLYGLYGTGFIYKNTDYVVTSSFVLTDAAFIKVLLSDGRSYRATITGQNDDLDIGVLKVEWGPDFHPVAPHFGDSSKLRLGQPMALVGRSVSGTDTLATAGIISAIRKEMPGEKEPTDEFLQFDAAFEFSYLGAPIVDVYGNVIGMAKGAADSGTNLNLGIPINDLASYVDRIIAGETKEIWFGVETQIVTEGLKQAGYAPHSFDWNGDGKAEDLNFGTWVSYVEPNSPADVAGLKVGDIIVEIDNSLIKYQYDWDSAMRGFRIGQLIYVEFMRKNQVTGDWMRQQAQVQLVESPKSKDDAKAKGKVLPAAPNSHPYSRLTGLGQRRL